MGRHGKKGAPTPCFIAVASARPFSCISALAWYFRPKGARPNVLFGTGGESAGFLHRFLAASWIQISNTVFVRKIILNSECSLKILQTVDFYCFSLTPKGEPLKINSLRKFLLGDLVGVIRLFRPVSYIITQ